MTSNPPGQCCIQGVKHEGTATGKLGKISKYDAYFAYPKDNSTERAIIIVTDLFGHSFINVQLIADQFAANGFFVVIPDIFHGDAIGPDDLEKTDLGKWLPNHLPPTVDPVITATLDELKTKYKAKRVGAVGYCFGAKSVVRFLKKDQINVGYVAHPSFVEEEELQEIQGPLAIAAAETDPIFTVAQRHKSEEILPTTKQPWQISLYSGVEHGFTVRADMSIPAVKLAKEQAFVQAVSWFNAWL